MSDLAAARVRAGNEKFHLPSLQVLRAIAALMVVFHHVSSGVNVFVHPVHPVIRQFFDYGFLGVDLFFVLSGFIITHAHFADPPGRAAAANFMRKRLVRIYPPFLPVAVAMVALFFLAPGVAQGGREISLASSLLLLPSSGDPALYVAWTLIHEMLFYSIFLAFYLSRRALLVALSLWACAIVGAEALQLAQGSARYTLGLLNLEFLVGVLVALGARHFDLSKGGIWRLLAGLALMGIALPLIPPDNTPAWSRIGFAAGIGLVVLQMVVCDRRRRLAWPAALLLVGNASYSLYLVHGPLISVMSRLAAGLGAYWPVVFGVQVVVCLAAGLLYYFLVERRSLSMINASMGRNR